MKKWFRSFFVVLLAGVLLSTLYASMSSNVLVIKAASSCDIVNDIPKTECQALEKLYDSTNGPNWKNRTNWRQSTTACNWYGILCKVGHVIALTLPLNQLSGGIPTELGNLKSLKQLDLGGNQLTGSIPISLTQLPTIEVLMLPVNQLSGQIPPQIGNLTSLTTLGLGLNQLTGSIPKEVGKLTKLSFLSLFQNRLTGPLPPEIGNLKQLKLLSLGSNQLSGDIGPMSNLINLQLVRMDHNQFNGSLPAGLGNLSQLTELTLGANRFSGSIPAQLGNLRRLQILQLSENQLSGPIPSQIGNITSLLTVTIGFNQLTGLLPKELGKLKNLTFLSLFSNQLTGSLPVTLTNLTQLKVLSLGENQLTGDITPLASLTNLRLIRLDHNQFNGPLPAGLGNLAQLTELTLGANKFSGSIPLEFRSLKNLSQLNLWHSQLSGNIPPELGELTNLQNLYLEDNQFTGVIPATLGYLSKLSVLNLERNQLTGALPASFAQLASLQELYVGGNLGLNKDLPRELTGLPNLTHFWFDNTRLCEPKAQDFQSWLGRISDLRRTSIPCATALTLKKTVTPALIPFAQVAQGIVATVQMTVTAEALAAINLTDTIPFSLTYVGGCLPASPNPDITKRQLAATASVAPGKPLKLCYQVKVDPKSSSGSLFDIPTLITGADAQTTRGSATIVVQNQQQVDTLVLLYVVADNDLGDEGVRLINNAEKAIGNSTTGTKVVTAVMLDGPNDNDAYVYYLQPDQTNLNCPNYTEHLCGNRYQSGKNLYPWREDSTSPEALQNFIVQAMNAYPNAGRVVLSLVGHGSGWSPDLLPAQPSGWKDQPGGLLWDRTTNRALSTADLGRVLSNVKATTGKKLALLYLDACSMAMSEVAYEIAPSVDYLLASENEAWAAFPYDRFLSVLPDAKTNLEIGQKWLNEEANTLQTQDGGYPFTLSLIDLSQLPTLAQSQKQLSTALRNALSLPKAKDALSATFQKTRCFDSNYDGAITPEDTYCDLRSFATQISKPFTYTLYTNGTVTRTLYTTVTKAAQQVLTTLANTVKAEVHRSGTPWSYPYRWDFGDTASELGGISIYLPLNPQHDEARRRYYTSQQLKWVVDTQWNEFLSEYWSTLNGNQRVYQEPPAVTPCTFVCHPQLKAAPLAPTITARPAQVTATVGSRVVVNLELTNMSKDQPLGSLKLSLKVAPTVLRLATCVTQNTVGLSVPIYECNVTPTTGAMDLALAASTSGITTDTIIARVEFTAVGQVGQASPLDVQITDFYNASNEKILVRDVDGIVKVGAAANFILGDANCSNAVDILDAIGALRLSAGKINSANSCPLQPNTLNTKACDVNKDTKCDATDALWIAQCQVNKPNPFCMGVQAAQQETRVADTNQQITAEPSRIYIGQVQQSADNQVTVPILAYLPTNLLGAATEEVHYDPTKLQLVACQSDLGQTFICNEDFDRDGVGLDAVRFSLLSTDGLASETQLVRLQFQLMDNSQSPISEIGSKLSLDTITFIDTEGRNLAEGANTANQIYLPIVSR